MNIATFLKFIKLILIFSIYNYYQTLGLENDKKTGGKVLLQFVFTRISIMDTEKLHVLHLSTSILSNLDICYLQREHSQANLI